MKPTPANFLSGRIHEVYLSGRWIAHTNVKQELDALNWQQAIRVLNGCNSIAALTFHLNYYLSGILDVMDGKPLSISDRFSFDMPKIENQEEWDTLRRQLYAHAENMAQRIGMMSEIQLSEPFVDMQYGSWHRNLESLIEHGYYHLGQMVLLKKMLATT